MGLKYNTYFKLDKTTAALLPFSISLLSVKMQIIYNYFQVFTLLFIIAELISVTLKWLRKKNEGIYRKLISTRSQIFVVFNASYINFTCYNFGSTEIYIFLYKLRIVLH